MVQSNDKGNNRINIAAAGTYPIRMTRNGRTITKRITRNKDSNRQINKAKKPSMFLGGFFL